MKKRDMTHHCMYLIHDGSLGSLDGASGSHKSDVTLNVAAVGLRDVDLAAGGLLHVFDGFSALTDDHTYGLRRHGDIVVDLFVVVASAVHVVLLSSAAVTVVVVHVHIHVHVHVADRIRIALTMVLVVALHDLQDELASNGGGLRGADQIDRAETVDAFLFPDNVDMTCTAFLKITNGFPTTADDETHGPVWDQDLCSVFTRSQGWSMGSHILHAAQRSEVRLSELLPVVGDDTEDLALRIISRLTCARNLALTKRSAGFGSRQELYACCRLILHAAQVLTLATDD